MAKHKEKRFQTYGGRWGEGKVHRYSYSRENKVWYVACREPYQDPHGREVDSDTPVTCKRCSNSVALFNKATS